MILSTADREVSQVSTGFVRSGLSLIGSDFRDWNAEILAVLVSQGRKTAANRWAGNTGGVEVTSGSCRGAFLTTPTTGPRSRPPEFDAVGRKGRVALLAKEAAGDPNA